MYCYNCEFEMKPDANFCTNCGIAKALKPNYSMGSFVLSFSPIGILAAGVLLLILAFFIFGIIFPNETKFAIAALFMLLFSIMMPLMILGVIVAFIASIVLGIIGLKHNKSLFAWAGIISWSIQILAVLLYFGITNLY